MTVTSAQATIAARIERVPLFSLHRKLILVVGKGALFDAAVADWRTLITDEDAVFDRDEMIDASAVAPTITWGTSPEHAITIDGLIPDPATATFA